MQELSRLEAAVAAWHSLHDGLVDAGELIELLALEEDPGSMLGELSAELERLSDEYERLEEAGILAGPHDQSNAILEINAGAGGTEACDWAQMLQRLYLRWAERQGFKVDIIDENPGEVAGIKSATLHLQGEAAYGRLKSERGVHRLVRISPYDAQSRRHTSFASVDVTPEIEEAEEIEVKSDDLRIDTFRSSGAGGQNVQKNETAVRLTHLPSGIVVSCQNERSQLKNRAFAMKVLRSRLAEVARQEQAAKLAALRGDQASIEWGSQIRSYVFQPYTLVKDHRTGEETGNVQAVMDGDIDRFISAYLKKFRSAT